MTAALLARFGRPPLGFLGGLPAKSKAFFFSVGLSCRSVCSLLRLAANTVSAHIAAAAIAVAVAAGGSTVVSAAIAAAGIAADD